VGTAGFLINVSQTKSDQAQKDVKVLNSTFLEWSKIICFEKECERARKRKWQQDKLLNDPDYRANQRECRKDWLSRHPGYYRELRQRNGKSAERNRLLQKFRDSRRRQPRPLAKMDAFKTAPVKESGHYYLLPVLARMDALAQKVILIPISYARRKCLQKRTR
jgi:hypothetical protein